MPRCIIGVFACICNDYLLIQRVSSHICQVRQTPRMAAKTPKTLLNSEWLTRKKLIDGMLISAGWKVVRFDPSKPLSSYNACAIEEYPTANGPADYALCADAKILGIVEAKKVSLSPQNVLSQAERYSRGILQPGVGS